MKTLFAKKYFLIVCSCFFPLLFFAQEFVPFKVRYQSYINGDMVVVSNNIVNRVDYSNSANVPYYNRGNNAKLNDELSMQYIDVDYDQSTYSSSSANLSLDNVEDKKIAYAGLYWSATYKYESGLQSKRGAFVPANKNRESFNSIKIKFPTQENYSDITGEIIFDGLNQKNVKEFAPYTVYCDITKQMQDLKTLNGTYTVANIKATQGMLSGGVAGGWTIFIVYEDQKLSKKFINSFDGFVGVTDKSTEISFKGFEITTKGEVNAKVACAALEGDNNLIGDQLLFKTPESEHYLELNNSYRKKDNFFNSSITDEDANVENRNPDSNNTLGYDACVMTIPNKDNSIINNNSKEATLRLISSGDRYFMFFSAFDIEVTEKPIINTEPPKEDTSPIALNEDNHSVEKQKINEPVAELKDTGLKVAELKDTELKVAELKDTKEAVANNDITNKNNLENNFSTIENNNTKIESELKKKYRISSAKKTYYLVANVFKVKRNAFNFKKKLRRKGFKAFSFINSKSGLIYVYIAKLNNKRKANQLCSSKFNKRYKKNLWILDVEKNQTSLAIK